MEDIETIDQYEKRNVPPSMCLLYFKKNISPVGMVKGVSNVLRETLVNSNY
jgi:hypothetical protein